MSLKFLTTFLGLEDTQNEMERFLRKERKEWRYKERHLSSSDAEKTEFRQALQISRALPTVFLPSPCLTLGSLHFLPVSALSLSLNFSFVSCDGPECCFGYRTGELVECEFHKVTERKGCSCGEDEKTFRGETRGLR